MKTLRISLVAFTFILAAVTIASARQNGLGDKLKKAKAASKSDAGSKSTTKAADKKKDAGMAVKGQGASNTQSSKTNTQSTTIKK